MSRFLITCLRIVLFFGIFIYTLPAFASENDELLSGYTTIIDESNNIILQTGIQTHVGDQYISEDNNLYEVIFVEGMLAKARYIHNESSLSPEQLDRPVQAPPETPQPLIAIYHSHTDECYIPNDGKSSISGNGSIMSVGDSMTKRLVELGYQAEHDKTLHDPHDANAYQRSRRTFMKLLQHQPTTLFDIHRDSAPLRVYQTTINGQDAAKILLVVGRQNQNRSTTREYARTIKATVDTKYKGLVRGIFLARGNYNQDLNPRSMLIEIGTQYNTLEAAQYSATLFADTVPSFIIQNPVVTSSLLNTIRPPAELSTENYLYDIAFIISGLIIGTIAYLYLSTGSWQEAKRKLYKFRKYEFTNFLGSRKKRKN